MKLSNDQDYFGLISIIFHWIIAVLTLSLFFIGLWMVELDYYDNWYQLAPWWHKGLGVLVMLLIISRWFWQIISPRPLPLSSIPKWQQLISRIVHFCMNIITIAIGVSGYLIVTAKGHALSIFGLIKIPSFISGVSNLEDVAGDAHFLLAYLLMTSVTIHVLAALKHHVINKDKTLIRMFGR